MGKVATHYSHCRCQCRCDCHRLCRHCYGPAMLLQQLRCLRGSSSQRRRPRLSLHPLDGPARFPLTTAGGTAVSFVRHDRRHHRPRYRRGRDHPRGEGATGTVVARSAMAGGGRETSRGFGVHQASKLLVGRGTSNRDVKSPRIFGTLGISWIDFLRIHAPFQRGLEEEVPISTAAPLGRPSWNATDPVAFRLPQVLSPSLLG